ncbi:AAA family ATPase [Halomonas sp. M4R5S39]|uniref:AAA family ATPase n=1 Tax=Halomonas kalidii TaxID=3043293 RepID=UPI0024A9B590|nr:AAA family ATPase [Halomonas kalidii]MDI5986426.1 AAA family ATPase [Halomonas kalidii]
MILTVQLKNYKIFHKNFLIQLSDPDKRFSSIIGKNGVGKSSVLEALDTLFNGRDWAFNSRYMKNSSYISCCAVIEREVFSRSIVAVAVSVDNFLKDFSGSFIEQRSTTNEVLSKFRHFLEKVATDKLLSLFGKNCDPKSNKKHYYAGDVIHGLLIDYLSSDLSVDACVAEEMYQKYCAECMSHFRFTYIPVEDAIPELLRIEQRLMKKILPTDIVSGIIRILDDKRITVHTRKRGRNPKKSPVQLINDDLNRLSRDINNTVKLVDEKYGFKSVSGTKNLTSRDLTNAIIETFFSARSFVKEGLPVTSLSSGEKRMALVDIVFSFLRQADDGKFNVMAIDEPENSLHISSGFEQFRKMAEITESVGCQVVCTSHWYGFIPIVSSGCVSHIENGKCDFFATEEFVPGSHKVPTEVLLRSGYELASSIIQSIRSEPVCWIVCEGLTDRRYLSRVFPEKEGFRVVAASNDISVINIYRQLSISLKSVNKKAFPGRVVCLIDTDPDTSNKVAEANGFTEVDGVLYFRRINYINESLRFSDLSCNDYSKCSIEDTLSPSAVARVLKKRTGYDFSVKPGSSFLEVNSQSPSVIAENGVGEIEGLRITKEHIFGGSPDQRVSMRYKHAFCDDYLRELSEGEVQALRASLEKKLPFK